MMSTEKIINRFTHPIRTLDNIGWKIANRHIHREVQRRFNKLDRTFPRDHYAWMKIEDDFAYQIFCVQENNLLQFVKNHFRQPIDTVIEIGAASDLFLKHIDAKQKIGINVLPECVKQLKQQGIEGRISNGLTIPANHEEADAVICLQTLEHVDDPIAFLKNMNHILKPNGFLVLSIPWVKKTNIRDYLYGDDKPNQPPSEYHIFEFDEVDFKKIVKYAGFSIKDSSMLQNYATGKDIVTRWSVMRHFALGFFPAVMAYTMTRQNHAS